MQNLLTIVCIATLVSVAVYLGLPALIKVYLRRRFLQRVQRSGSLCLTFDDGPVPHITPKLLDLLATAGIRATFCVQGKNAQEHPDLIQRMLQDGHQVAGHGYEHMHPWRTWPGRCLADLRRGQRVVARLAGPAAARFVRPPYGKLDLLSLVDLLSRHRVLVYWNVDPRDYDTTEADTILARLSGQLKPGAVILLHDRAEDLPTALEGILAEITAQGIPTATVADAWDRTT